MIDVATGKMRQITGFATKEVTMRERKRILGPSPVTFRRGHRLRRQPWRLHRLCTQLALASMPDGLAYVAATKEVWVTTPRDKSIRILDSATLHEKATLTFEGSPEGFAVDSKRYRFYTNLEDKDRTLAIDLKSHKTLETWNPSWASNGAIYLAYGGASYRVTSSSSPHPHHNEKAACGPIAARRLNEFRVTASCRPSLSLPASVRPLPSRHSPVARRRSCRSWRRR